MKLKIFLSTIFFLSLSVNFVYAQPSYVSDPNDYADAFHAPVNCPTSFVPDLSCTKAKVLRPNVDCFENKCPSAASYDTPSSSASGDTFDELEVFGVKFYVNSAKRFAAILNILISTFLGVVSMYALLRGIYVGGYIRANTIDANVIASANKEFLNLMIGFAISWGFIFILQFFMSFLGYGSINQLVLFGDQTNNPEIVINP